LSDSTIALPNTAIVRRLFHQEKAALHGGGISTQIVEPLEKQKAWPSAMPFSPNSIPISAFSRETVLTQSLPALPLEPLNSINTIHRTAKPNNYRQTSKKYFQNSFWGQNIQPSLTKQKAWPTECAP